MPPDTWNTLHLALGPRHQLLLGAVQDFYSDPTSTAAARRAIEIAADTLPDGVRAALVSRETEENS